MSITSDIWNIILNQRLNKALIYSYEHENAPYLFQQISALILINKASRIAVYRFLYTSSRCFTMHRLSQTRKRLLNIYRQARQDDILKSVFNITEKRTPLTLKHCYNDSEMIRCVFKSSEKMQLLIVIDLGNAGGNRRYLITGARNYYQNPNTQYLGFSLNMKFNYDLIEGKEIHIYHVAKEEMLRISNKVLNCKKRDLRKNFYSVRCGDRVPNIKYIQKYKWVFNSASAPFNWDHIAKKPGNLLSDEELLSSNQSSYYDFMQVFLEV